MYPRIGLDSITDILRKPLDATAVAQLTFLVHVTKMKWDVEMSAFLFRQANKMKIIEVLSDDVAKWKLLVAKVIRHEEVTFLTR